MRRLYLATICLLAGGITATAPAVAQTTRAQDCLGTIHGDTCEVSETGARRMEWNRMVREQDDLAAQSRALQAEARAEHEAGSLSRVQQVMRRRRAAAAAAGN